MKNVISQFLGLDLVNINAYAKVHQNIPLSSRDRAIFTFSEFEPWQCLGQSQMTLILTISWATSCQYQCVCKILSKYSKRSKSYKFTVFRILNQSQMSFNTLMDYIMSVSMYMQNFITIIHSVQEIGPFSFFQNLELGKASTDEKCHFAISWARSC